MFKIITAGTGCRRDVRERHAAPNLSGDLSIDVIYNANNVILQILTPYSADFDGDGDVDGDDFLIWQSAFGSNTDGDADNDGDTDGDDFLIWQSEFGSGVGSNAGVPEPASVALLSLLAVACIASRRRLLCAMCRDSVGRNRTHSHS